MDASIISRIKDVAILLRKSRGEIEDLHKHKKDLIELCEENHWRYTIYEEISSSQKFDERPELIKLIQDIEDGEFDAVVVMDKDRLSRESVGQANINKVLAENECLIVTPQKIYDLNDESDILISEVQDLMSRFEYRMISKRLRRGKKRASKDGKWANGRPPIPYLYDREQKSLVVDEEKKEIYRYIIDEFLNGTSPYNIAWELNKMKVPSPRDGMFWRDVTVRRLLVDETHLGRIIANKTGKWKRSKGSVSYVTNKKEDWIVREGCHEAVKTIEEHDKIMIEMNKRKRPAYAKDGKFALAGLIKCSKCGKTMSFKEKKDDYPIVYRCRNFLEDGITKCGNLGGSAKILIEEIHRQLYKYKDDIEKEIKRAKSEQGITSNIHNDIFEKEKQIEQLETDLESVDELVIAKYFTPQEAIKKKQKILQKIEQLEIEINTLNMQNLNYENMTNTDRISKIEDLLNIITDETMPPHKINRAYKSIIHSIIWEKETDDELSVTVNFL